MSLGSRIRDARKAAGMTQLDLARALVDHDERLAKAYDKSVGAWERDESPRLPFYVVVAIAKATRTPLEFFDDPPGTVWAARSMPAASVELDEPAAIDGDGQPAALPSRARQAARARAESHDQRRGRRTPPRDTP